MEHSHTDIWNHAELFNRTVAIQRTGDIPHEVSRNSPVILRLVVRIEHIESREINAASHRRRVPFAKIGTKVGLDSAPKVITTQRCAEE